MTDNYDAWLEKPYQDQWKGEGAIEARTKQIFRDCERNTYSGLMEGLDNQVDDEDIKLIAEYLETQDFEKLGRLLWVIQTDYWEEQSYKQACKEYEDGLIN